MYRPVLVIPAALPPVSLSEAKLHLRVDHEADDALIEGLIGGATRHLDGWTGILGACLVEQTWRQDFDRFDRDLFLPLGPVIDISSITWRHADGTTSTISPSAYDLMTDHAGRSVVRFGSSFAYPADVSATHAIAVSYRAGYETILEVPAVEPGPGDPPDPPGSPSIPARVTVPEPLRTAIMMMVAHWYNNREAVAQDTLAELPIGVASLLAPFRRVGL